MGVKGHGEQRLPRAQQAPTEGSPHPSLFLQDPGVDLGEAGWGLFWPMRLCESNGTGTPSLGAFLTAF